MAQDLSSLIGDLQAWVRQLNGGLITPREFESKVLQSVLCSPVINPDLPTDYS